MASNSKTDNQDPAAVATTTASETGGNGQNDPRVTTPHQSQSQQAQGQENTDKFVDLVRGINIADLEKEIKEDGETTSILGKFKDFKKDLIGMAEKGTTEDNIITFVVDCIGIRKGKAILFAARLQEAYPKPQSNGM